MAKGLILRDDVTDQRYENNHQSINIASSVADKLCVILHQFEAIENKHR